MAGIFPLPYYTGQPLGTLSLYLTGTLTLATIYADADGTIPLPNPVTADVDGRFPAIYLTAGTEYRVIEKNELGVTLADVDPVNPPVPIGGGTVTGDLDVVGTVRAQTPASGTAGGFQLVGNATSGFSYFQVLGDDGVTEWGNWRYDSTGLARWSAAMQVQGALTVSGAFTGAAASFSGRALTVPHTVAAATTTTINTALSNAFIVTMGTNVTTLSLSNATAGQALSIVFKQDATGNRTIAWPGTFKWAGGAAPVLSTAANAVDFLSAQFIDGAWHAALAKGFA